MRSVRSRTNLPRHVTNSGRVGLGADRASCPLHACGEWFLYGRLKTVLGQTNQAVFARQCIAFETFLTSQKMGFSSTTSTGPLSLQVHSISNKAWTSIMSLKMDMSEKNQFFSTKMVPCWNGWRGRPPVRIFCITNAKSDQYTHILTYIYIHILHTYYYRFKYESYTCTE